MKDLWILALNTVLGALLFAVMTAGVIALIIGVINAPFPWNIVFFAAIFGGALTIVLSVTKKQKP
jgi:hypothetical protein